jgi:hypothetical protein
MAKHRQKHLFPELDSIIEAIKADNPQDLVILFIPSHDKKQVEIPNQEQWADASLNRFGLLFRGGTGFETFAGVYRDDDGIIIRDKPLMIQAYVDRENIVDPVNMKQLLSFAKRMGRETDQAAVALIVNNRLFLITQFGS